LTCTGAEESTDAAGSHSVVLAAASVHVPTFDLGFVLSSSDEETDSIQTTVLLQCLCEVRRCISGFLPFH